MFLLIIFSCGSKQNISSTQQLVPDKAVDNVPKNVPNIEIQEQHSFKEPVSKYSNKISDISKLHCASQHVNRTIRVIETQLPNEERGYNHLLFEHRAGVSMVVDFSVENPNVELVYGDLYQTLSGHSFTRTIFLDSFDVESQQDGHRITWKQSLDKYARPNRIIDEKDTYIVGDISIALEGKDGFYKGTLQFSDVEEEVSISCWRDQIQNVYTYKEGKCLNQNQEEGYNPWTLEMVRITKNGECSDLSGMELHDGFLNHQNLDWNVKGSNLENTDVAFSEMIGIQLQGASFESMTMGYVTIEGDIDAFTKYPEYCTVNRNKTTIFCRV